MPNLIFSYLSSWMVAAQFRIVLLLCEKLAVIMDCTIDLLREYWNNLHL